MSPLRPIVALLAGEDRSREDEIAEARRELDEALAALRAARGAWESPHMMDIDALRRALDQAERQLDAARVRLHRALERT
jgi:multidrug efflux pump subunit AcrA (membrane-fusion protein)